ncbi:MAG: single-strand DNA-binding protein [Myxococcota bacterium]|jgi:single-strand DNA-binding protein
MSINSVFLVGRLGAAPELKTTRTGKAVCNLRIATDGRHGGDEPAPPDWHRVVVWERAAENCYKYLDRGSQVAVQGRLRTDKWERNGEPRYTTEIVARTVTFLGKKTDAGTPADEAPVAPVAPEVSAPMAEPASRPAAKGRARGRQRAAPDRHDDIPF